MFDRLMSYFSSSSSKTSTLEQEKIDNTPKNTSGKTWVYIWRMTPQNVGHAAIQVGGDSPKKTADQPGDYVSIHPKSIPAVGPTIILPLPATLATTLNADMETEAASNQNENLEMAGIPTFTEKTLSSLPPDFTFEIEGLNTNTMQECIHTVQKQVETGETSYQLLPEVDTTGYVRHFLRDAPAFMGFDPIDIELHRRRLPKDESIGKRYNCTMLVKDILKSGGMNINSSNTPWGLTPTGLAEELQGFENKKFKL